MKKHTVKISKRNLKVYPRWTKKGKAQRLAFYNRWGIYPEDL